MRETWYVLEDDSPGNPAECSLGEDGIFRHKDGLAVKMRSADTPMSRGVDVDDDDPARESRELKSEKPAKPGKGAKPGTYKTREAKGE